MLKKIMDFILGKKENKPENSHCDEMCLLYGESPLSLKDEKAISKYFEFEIKKTASRYVSGRGANLNISFKDAFGEPLSLCSVFHDAFEQWKEVKSLPDRRSIIFEIFDNLMGDKLDDWRLAERYIEDRRGLDAIEILTLSSIPKEEREEYCASYAKAFMIMGDYKNAVEWAKKGLSYNSKHLRSNIILADIYHVTNDHTRAHKIYNKILKGQSLELNCLLENIFSFDSGILRSPILASSLLRNAPEEIWEKIETEFYYSPHFRCSYAYYLLNKNSFEYVLKAFAKILTLAKEMPWFQEAVINAHAILEQVDILGSQFEEEKKWLQQLIIDQKYEIKNNHTIKTSFGKNIENIDI
ncbi:tetratricopeptide repeat protein [Candidatus Uabimicrobium sp. HlEnr_7]|uniref:tetratricopeptide repeat protein n=1 Tax=Candidatus Uabimicrobium helgolandensis TaxID=3095367 RepID=UPI003558EA2D